MRYSIVIWHGEARSLFYVVDADAPEDEQPAVIATAHSYEEAEAIRNEAIRLETQTDQERR